MLQLRSTHKWGADSDMALTEGREAKVVLSAKAVELTPSITESIFDFERWRNPQGAASAYRKASSSKCSNGRATPAYDSRRNSRM